MNPNPKDLTAENAESAEEKQKFCKFSVPSVAKKWFLVVILLLAFGLRVHNLEVQSFWNDEGNSARLSERSIPLIIEGTASDIHPPLYYLLLRGWRELVGETEFGLRSLSAFTGVLMVAFAFGVGKNLTQSRRLFSTVIPRSSEKSFQCFAVKDSSLRRFRSE